MKIIKEKEKLCKCDPIPHVHHQYCQGCAGLVPVSLDTKVCYGSVSHCCKCDSNKMLKNTAVDFSDIDIV